MSEENTVAEEAQTPDINLNDIRNILSVIDACASRGAFKGEEMQSVGALRNKVAAFVEANIPQEEEPADEDEGLDPEGRTPPEEPTEEPAAE